MEKINNNLLCQLLTGGHFVYLQSVMRNEAEGRTLPRTHWRLYTFMSVYLIKRCIK